MTREQILKEADNRFKIKATDCRQMQLKKQYQKQQWIERQLNELQLIEQRKKNI